MDTVLGLNSWIELSLSQSSVKIMHNSLNSHSPIKNSKQAAMIFMTYTMVFLGETVRVRFDRGSVLSSVLACLSLDFCPTFPFLSPLLKTV